jgi:3-deoxy-manno-octulosonate cytidylyltransferase (CMP-KDO synthetase)
MNTKAPLQCDVPPVVVGVIPARLGSTRLPEKCLIPICGKPLVCWVVERALQACRLDSVLVATDDRRILEAVENIGADAVMTDPDHPSGTDRVAEAVRTRHADIVVNIQGDEPMIDPALIDALSSAVTDGTAWDMATAATPIRREDEIQNPDIVKVVFDAEGRALYFSRSVIPHVRDPGDEPDGMLHWRHLGVYAYRRRFLEQFVSTPTCPTERSEKLEQLRALHIGARIRVVETEDAGMGVDTLEDAKYVESLMRERGIAP